VRHAAEEPCRAEVHDGDLVPVAFGRLLTTDDAAEGVAAFRENRDPEFTGK
jgi:1,4-dihydroxy-2-naphthoyl-CoA synthase